MFAAGRRWFTAGCFTLILVSLLHTAGKTLPSPPTDAEYIGMAASMREYLVPLGLGMSPSVWDIYMSLVFTMSVCLAGIGALGLVLVSSAEATPRLVARMAVALCALSAALTILYAFFQVTPALISLVVVTLLFAVAAITGR